jgi:hypothetical protein
MSGIQFKKVMVAHDSNLSYSEGRGRIVFPGQSGQKYKILSKIKPDNRQLEAPFKW